MATDELKTAFQELQKKMVDTRSKVQLRAMQIDSKEREVRRSELTLQEVGQLPNDARLFQSSGRMFILHSKQRVCATLGDKIKSNKKEISDLKANAQKLQQSYQQSEDTLREMVKQRMKEMK
eukprot:m.39206 g.39206  ORF g.39206 m.39206 type:complete len:122 (+) comp16605_c0_seq2:117-482(+)